MSVRSSWVRDTQLAVAVVSTLPHLSPLLVQERKQNSLNKRTIVLTKKLKRLSRLCKYLNDFLKVKWCLKSNECFVANAAPSPSFSAPATCSPSEVATFRRVAYFEGPPTLAAPSQTHSGDNPQCKLCMCECHFVCCFTFSFIFTLLFFLIS